MGGRGGRGEGRKFYSIKHACFGLPQMEDEGKLIDINMR